MNLWSRKSMLIFTEKSSEYYDSEQERDSAWTKPRETATVKIKFFKNDNRL